MRYKGCVLLLKTTITLRRNREAEWTINKYNVGDTLSEFNLTSTYIYIYIYIVINHLGL